MDRYDEPLVGPAARAPEDRQELLARLGLNVPAQWWPTAPMLKGFEAAGFGWVQVHSPPRGTLCEHRDCMRHAAALRGALQVCGLRLVLHGPDDLSAGSSEHDQALDGLLDYAAEADAEYVVYHGANFAVADGSRAAAQTRQRASAEEEALRARARRIESLGFTLAVENLAPVFPGPPRLCHSPEIVRALVQRLDSPRVGMLLDVGHANITTGVPRALDVVLDEVVLFHLHDNLGLRLGGPAGGALDPLRLDLHLAPGNGSVPWREIASRLRGHPAPARARGPSAAPSGRPAPRRGHRRAPRRAGPRADRRRHRRGARASPRGGSPGRRAPSPGDVQNGIVPGPGAPA